MYLLEQRFSEGATETFFASIEDARHAVSEGAIWAIWERRFGFGGYWVVADCHPDFLPF